MKSQKKERIICTIIAFIISVIMGIGAGIVACNVVDKIYDRYVFDFCRPIYFLLALIGILIAFFLQTILHEVGHLIFGLFSGYKFSSFRILSFIWTKENEKIKFRRVKIAGTGGQCLMSPPEEKDGEIPVILYNLGGVIMNLIVGAISLGLYFVTQKVLGLPDFFLVLSIFGGGIALLNGVPLKLNLICNDGDNVLSLTKNKEARHAFYLQMKINELVTRGIRLKDMPSEWFIVPTDEAMKNSMVATIGVFVCNRLMDTHQFEEAKELIDRLLKLDTGMVNLHRNLLICDYIYIGIITNNRSEAISYYKTEDYQKFMKTMQSYPSILRTKYVYALMVELDGSKAKITKELFNRYIKKYPYPGEIKAEKEFIEIANDKYIEICSETK